MTLEQQLKAIAKRKQGQIDQATRATLLRLTQGVISKTPVRDGIAKGNWLAAVGAPKLQYDLNLKNKGSVNVEIPALQNNTVFYFTNALPYIRRLEFGWSEQAPAGMLRTTLTGFNRIAQEEFKRYVN